MNEPIGLKDLDWDAIAIAGCIEQSRGLIPSNRKHEIIERLKADAKALADVRTLDEWAETELGRAWRSSNDGRDRRVTLYADQRIHQVFATKTPDAARAKAAAWAREQKP